MNQTDFNDIFEKTVSQCRNVLCSKAKEYATEDRLHNFKQAAHIQSTTPVKALGGMMSKHTVSIYDMIHSGDVYSSSLWNEKITDSINYLILLRALIEDEGVVHHDAVMYADDKVYYTEKIKTEED